MVAVLLSGLSFVLGVLIMYAGMQFIDQNTTFHRGRSFGILMVGILSVIFSFLSSYSVMARSKNILMVYCVLLVGMAMAYFIVGGMVLVASNKFDDIFTITNAAWNNFSDIMRSQYQMSNLCCGYLDVMDRPGMLWCDSTVPCYYQLYFQSRSVLIASGVCMIVMGALDVVGLFISVFLVTSYKKAVQFAK